jgi:FAD/FMN-containing dehydrogenase
VSPKRSARPPRSANAIGSRPAAGATPETATSTPPSRPRRPTTPLATRAADAALELFALAIELGGSVSGEHGVGLVKAGQLRNQWSSGAADLHRGIKQLFDPRNLLNPGKKAA